MSDPTRLPGLAGRIVVVTGAAGGQGLAESRLLVENGAHVVVADLADEPGDEVRALRDAGPGSVRYHRLDVSSPAEWEELAGSLAGARELAHEHVMHSFELLTTILEHVGADFARTR